MMECVCVCVCVCCCVYQAGRELSLWEAAERNDVTAARILVEAGVFINLQQMDTLDTALHFGTAKNSFLSSICRLAWLAVALRKNPVGTCFRTSVFAVYFVAVALSSSFHCFLSLLPCFLPSFL